MRFVVLLFGFVGVLLTGAAAFALFFIDPLLTSVNDVMAAEAPKLRAEAKALQEQGKEAEAAEKRKQADSLGVPKEFSLDPTGVSPGNAAIFYAIVALYGLFGVLLAFLRCGKQGGTLILISVLMAAFINPYFTPFLAVLGLTALMAFLVGPLPINAPPPKKAAVADDDED